VPSLVSTLNTVIVSRNNGTDNAKDEVIYYEFAKWNPLTFSNYFIVTDSDINDMTFKHEFNRYCA
jgi:hypothetical protein